MSKPYPEWVCMKCATYAAVEQNTKLAERYGNVRFGKCPVCGGDDFNLVKNSDYGYPKYKGFEEWKGNNE